MNALLSAISKLAGGIAIGANAVGTLMVLGLVAVVNYDVVARGVFNSPFLGAVEVVQFSMVFIVFMQLPDVVRVNRLTASDGFQIVIGQKFPRFTRWLRRAINLLAALFMGLIAYAVWPQFIEEWHTQDFFGVPGVFTAPWWPIKLVICLSAGLCTILFVIKIFRPREDVQLVRAGAGDDAG